MKQVMTEEQRKNLEVAQRINRETRARPDSPYTGKYVAIFNQQVVAVADTLDELGPQLDGLGDNSDDAVWIEASADYEQTYYIWEWH